LRPARGTGGADRRRRPRSGAHRGAGDEAPSRRPPARAPGPVARDGRRAGGRGRRAGGPGRRGHGQGVERVEGLAGGEGAGRARTSGEGGRLMFYLLYLYYADVAKDYPLLNLVQYQTVRVALAMATAMIVAVAMGSRFIAWMRVKQGKGQPIR